MTRSADWRGVDDWLRCRQCNHTQQLHTTWLYHEHLSIFYVCLKYSYRALNAGTQMNHNWWTTLHRREEFRKRWNKLCATIKREGIRLPASLLHLSDVAFVKGHTTVLPPAALLHIMQHFPLYTHTQYFGVCTSESLLHVNQTVETSSWPCNSNIHTADII